VTELVINALKHAFPESTIDGQVVVGYEVHDANWKLSISDNGAGMPDLKPGAKKTGLGTSLINALAQQLDAQVEIISSPDCVAYPCCLRLPLADRCLRQRSGRARG